MTGNPPYMRDSNDAIMANYAQNGFAGVVVKPYTMDELDAELQRVLGKK